MPEQLELTVDVLADAIAWTRKNPEAWEAVVAWAHEDHAAGTRVSTRAYACILRRPHFSSLLGLRRMGRDPVLVNDHVTAGLARLLKRLYPDLDVDLRDRVSDHWKVAP